MAHGKLAMARLMAIYWLLALAIGIGIWLLAMALAIGALRNLLI